jgi:hypothetical protein
VCRARAEDDFVLLSLALFEACTARCFHRLADSLQLGLLRFVQFLEGRLLMFALTSSKRASMRSIFSVKESDMHFILGFGA